MRASVRSLPAWSGRCRCSQTAPSSAMAAAVSGRWSFGCGDVYRMRRTPSTAPTAARPAPARCRGGGGVGELRPPLAAPEVAAVRVHVLAEQGDLDHAVGDELLDLADDVAHAPADLGPPHARHDAERARVVAADLDRDPGLVIDLAAS